MFPRLHISLERWRKNEEYGVYVSTEGRIRLMKNKQLLEPRIGKNGYLHVFTCKGARSVHTIVAETWLPNEYTDVKCTVDHINSNKRDNSIKNLRWVSPELNSCYAEFVQVSQELLQENVELLNLIKNGKLAVYANNQPVNYQTILGYKPATMSALEFVNRIRKAYETKTKYCGFIWELKEIKETPVAPVGAPAPISPSVPDSVDTQRMLAMFNERLDEKTRGRAALALYQENKINIKADSFEFKNFEDFNKKREDLAGKIEPEVFIGRILKVANKLKTYCNHFWTVEPVSN